MIKVIDCISDKKKCSVKNIVFKNKNAVGNFFKSLTKSVMIEINLLMVCDNLNIIKPIDLVRFDDMICIIFPREDYTLADYIIKYNYDTCDIILQIANAVRYLHHHRIVHMDLKLDNILITNDIIKISDFGSAEFLFGDDIIIDRLKTTITHCPPEVFDTECYRVNCSFDIWSLGIIIYELFNGAPIYLHKMLPSFNGFNGDEYIDNVQKVIFGAPFIRMLKDTIPIEFHDCLQFDRNKRPSIDHIFHIISQFGYDLTNNVFMIPGLCLYKSIDSGKHSGIYFGEEYYGDLLYDIGEKYPREFKRYPYAAIDMTFDLIHRVTDLYRESINKKIIDTIINMVHSVVPDSDIIDINEFIPKMNKKIAGDIIINLSGVLFYPLVM